MVITVKHDTLHRSDRSGEETKTKAGASTCTEDSQNETWTKLCAWQKKNKTRPFVCGILESPTRATKIYKWILFWLNLWVSHRLVGHWPFKSAFPCSFQHSWTSTWQTAGCSTTHPVHSFARRIEKLSFLKIYICTYSWSLFLHCNTRRVSSVHHKKHVALYNVSLLHTWA